jgi:hypothetical protein
LASLRGELAMTRRGQGRVEVEEVSRAKQAGVQHESARRRLGYECGAAAPMCPSGGERRGQGELGLGGVAHWARPLGAWDFFSRLNQLLGGHQACV